MTTAREHYVHGFTKYKNNMRKTILEYLDRNLLQIDLTDVFPWEKKMSPWTHGELTVSSPWAHGDHGSHGSGAQWSRLSHGYERSQLSHGEVTAQSRVGHSSVTARSQLNHGIFSMITARSRLSHGWLWPFWLRSRLSHGQVTAQSRLAVTILVTVSSLWAHGEQSRWPFFFHGLWVIMIGPELASFINTYHRIPFVWNLHVSMSAIWLERLRSEDTPAASWSPIPLSHIGSQVKGRQSQSYKF